MRHGKKVNHLGRTDSHRKAMLANMATSLIKHKRITTTLAKAKALRKYVEPLITKSKSDTTHSRRTVFSYLKDKEAITILFREVSEKVATRPGGYTRIIKLENRLGDNAEMAFIELVDYNEVYGKTAQTEKKTTRRRGGKKKTTADVTPAAEVEAKAEEVKAEEEEVAAAAVVEDVVVEGEEAVNAEEATTEETPETKDSSATEEEEKKD